MMNESKILNRKLLHNGHTWDWSLLWMTILLTAFSLLMVYSASIAHAAHKYDNQFYYLLRQTLFALGGGMLAFGVSRIPMHKWKKWTPWLLGGSIASLFVVLAVAEATNGAKRWIPLGVFNFQPTEFFKLVVIFYLASFFTRRAEILRQFKKVWFVALPIALGLGLISFQKDLGSMVVIGVIAVVMLFLAGLPFHWFLGIIALGVLGTTLMIIAYPYRISRINAFLDPWADPLGTGFQLTHSLMAISRGGWLGVGLGASVEKRFYLPEAHTDFIVAVMSEELGAVGVLILVFCYLWLTFRAFSIGKQASSLDLYFNAFVAKGIGIWLGIQSFFNIGVNLGLLPPKGLTLPFVSYGGTAITMALICIALLLRVDFENRRLMRGYTPNH